MKILTITSLFLLLTSYTFACSICESKCEYEQARAEQQFRWLYEYREIMHAGYADELHLREQLRNRRRREILNNSYYSGSYSLNRPHYNYRYGSYKGGSYIH